MIIQSQFKPLWWLPNGHAQTIFSTLTNKMKAPVDHWERIELADGDFIDLAWAVNGLSADSPVVILLHGLAGSVNSSYVAKLLTACNQSGYRGVLMHFRGAGREPNRLARAYHSGDTEDLAHLLAVLNEREGQTRKAVIGISLGGNVLLKWLGQTGNKTLIHAAVAVSVPFQLQLVVEKINKGFSRLYQSYLLQGLRSVFLKKLDMINTQFPLSKNKLFSLKNLRAFDEQITAPLHGFADAQTYYNEASSRQYLHAVRTPTLIIHALDDPFMIPEAIPDAEELSPYITLELSKFGGHVGFIAAAENSRTPSYWLGERIPRFLFDYLG